MRHLALTSLLLLCGALLFPGSGRTQEEPIAVFVHPAVDKKALNADELRSIFRTETRYWSGGKKVAALNLPPSHPVRQSFDRVVLGMEPEAMVKHWIDRTVRGGARPPRTVPTVALMARVIQKLPGAIGYTPASAVPAGAKVVARIANGRVARVPAPSAVAASRRAAAHRLWSPIAVAVRGSDDRS